MGAKKKPRAERFDLAKLEDARSALYGAAVSLPFDIYKPLPVKKLLAGQFIELCQRWHDDVATLYNRAIKQCLANIHPGNSHADLIPASALIGNPPVFDGRQVFRSVPPMNVAAFADRCRQEQHVDMLSESMGIGRGRVDPKPAQQARHLCLDLRRRALELEPWLRRAIKTFQTALLPKIELGEMRPNNRREAKVIMAGEVYLRNVRFNSAQALLSLKSKGEFEFWDRKELWRFNKDFRELEHHLQKVSGERKGRPLRGLSDNLRELITEAPKKPQTQPQVKVPANQPPEPS